MPEFNYSLLKSHGDDVYISSNVEIKRPHLVTVGSHVAIDSYQYWTTQVTMGDFIHVAPMCTIIGGELAELHMGNFVTIAAGSRIIVLGDGHNGFGLISPVIPEQYRDELVGGRVDLDDFVGLGTNAVIMPGVWIAKGVVVGANSLVTKDIREEWTIWAGSPARKIKDRRSDIMLRYARELGYE